MFNRMCIGLILALIGVTMVHAADKPVIFINTNLAPTGKPGVDLNSLVAANGGYKKFMELAESLGYEVRHGYLTSITPEVLEPVDLFILAIPGMTLMDEDKQAIVEFVRKGGGFFVLAYPENLFANAYLSNLESLLTNYGITFGQSSYNSIVAAMKSGTPFLAPEPVQEIRSPEGHVALLVDPVRAQTIASSNSGRVMAAYSINTSLLGSGKVLVVADFMMPFYQKLKLQTVDNLHLSNNAEFFTNVLLWFKGSADLTPLKVKVQKGPHTVGGTATVKVKVKNLGSSESVATTLVLTLCSVDGTSAGEEIKSLRKIDLPAIAPGAAKTIKTSVTFPAFLATGQYCLKAVVDPQGQSGDADTGNNAKTSVTFTIN